MKDNSTQKLKLLEFKPLQKIQIIYSKPPITEGSIGFIAGAQVEQYIKISSTRSVLIAPLYVVIIKRGKRGKNRISVMTLHMVCHETDKVKEKKFGNINFSYAKIIDRSKNILSMPTEEFLGYIAAFSFYLGKLENHINLSQVASTEAAYHYLRNPDHKITSKKLLKILYCISNFNVLYELAVEVFNDNKARSFVMNMLQNEFIYFAATTHTFVSDLLLHDPKYIKLITEKKKLKPKLVLSEERDKQKYIGYSLEEGSRLMNIATKHVDEIAGVSYTDEIVEVSADGSTCSNKPSAKLSDGWLEII